MEADSWRASSMESDLNSKDLTEVVYVAAQSSGVRISKNWRKISEIYKMFAVGEYFDLSEDAAEEMFLFETRGEGDLHFGLFSDRRPNGFAVGKRYMNVAIEMWKKDIQLGLLFRQELEEDFPEWFLDKFLGNVRQGWPINLEQTLNLYQKTCVQEGVSERRDE